MQIPDDGLSAFIANAREKIKAEEDFKGLLNDRSGPDAPRPSQEFIDFHVGKPRTPDEIEAAILDRAQKDYRASREPTSGFAEPDQEAKSRAAAIKARRQQNDQSPDLDKGR